MFYKNRIANRVAYFQPQTLEHTNLEVLYLNTKVNFHSKLKINIHGMHMLEKLQS